MSSISHLCYSIFGNVYDMEGGEQCNPPSHCPPAQICVSLLAIFPHQCPSALLRGHSVYPVKVPGLVWFPLEPSFLDLCSQWCFYAPSMSPDTFWIHRHTVFCPDACKESDTVSADSCQRPRTTQSVQRVMVRCLVAKSLDLIECSQPTSLQPLMYFYVCVISNTF